MQIIKDYPPNYKDITKAFDIENKPGIVFTYGDKLYVPSGQTVLDKHLIKHEETHVKQQRAMGVEYWWARYLIDAGFRFIQELEAYRAQYRSMASLSLEQRLGYLDHISSDLSGPMYGNLLSKDSAKTAITDGIILKHVNSGGKNTRKFKKLKRQNRKKGRK